MKLVVIAVVGWFLVMASVFMVGGVLESTRRMVGAPAEVIRLAPAASVRSTPATVRARRRLAARRARQRRPRHPQA